MSANRFWEVAVYYSDSGSCQRSPDAYAPLIAAARGYSLTFVACSGATTAEVISSQLGALSPSTALVTITIGGNDTGFATVIEDTSRSSTTAPTSSTA
jgi:hypothetical protein